MTINPGEIQRIDLLKNAGSAALYGARGGNGVIAFYSKTISSAPNVTQMGPTNSNVKGGMSPFTLIGYSSVQREFYVPRYEVDAPTAAESVDVDRRDVLYWKAFAQTDTRGETTLLFPLSDVGKTIRVSVEGITTGGRPVSTSKLVVLK